ncbi:hypothetical protein SAMN05444360_10613 [Chryseobacterium carnipullorum]|uniref:hypothetical protein n=1 Tax=Chryseobacterium carnipullorum TaxID=1124835 RepID=UPI0009238931|nr:hypothetical protein [Chryseobacterium carnipullorum]SHL92673.1 hypothetical protein SAMN05444360_10613 [Chryseobacterium carnipullorum]
MIKLIKAEKTEFIYWDNFEYKINDNILVSEDATRYISSNELLNVCRPIFTKYYKKNVFMLDYLFWIDNIDIQCIDFKVENNTFRDIDFERSIKTYFLNNLKCFNCGKTYKGALSVDPVLVYPNNFELKEKKIKMINDENKIVTCQKCGNSFTSKVLYIFPDLVID